MKPQSAKAKGRGFQQAVRDCLLSEFAEILQAGDVVSTSMGAAGDDLQLSPLAKVMLPFSFEMKKVESPSVGATLRQAHARSGNGTIPVCVFGKNRVKLPNALTIIPHIFFCRLFNGEQFQYDYTQNKVVPRVVDTDYWPLDYPQWGAQDTDVSCMRWNLKEHLPNTCNLWLQWEEMEKKNGKMLPAAIRIFANVDDLGPHVILPFGHFVRLVKLLWEKSSVRTHLLRLPKEEKEERKEEDEEEEEEEEESASKRECIVIDEE